MVRIRLAFEGTVGGERTGIAQLQVEQDREQAEKKMLVAG